MSKINIPVGSTEIYAVTLETGRYDCENDTSFPCEFDDHADYPKYYTDYIEAKAEYDAIVIDDTGEYPQRKVLTVISLVDSEHEEEVTNF